VTSPPPGWRNRPGQGLGFELLGWSLCLAALGWAYTVHHGIGPRPYGVELAWFEPRGFLRGWSAVGWAFETTPRLLLVLSIPALLLAAGVFIATRSALARSLALASAVAVLLFGFYGSYAVRVWELFFWRGSAVLALTALALAFALCAPLLARSWLRLGWPLRLATYLPVVFVVVAFLRNATGTDPDLQYAISPWPAVSLYGIEVGGLFLMLAYAGAALATFAVSRGEGGGRVAVGLGAGLLVPPLVLWLCDLGGLLPFRVDASTLLPLLALAACALGGTVWRMLRRPEELPQRALALSVGAALLALPILGGQLLARFDYFRAREHHAREIIDALEQYLEREDLYPDELVELVNAGDLAAIPNPDIGFRFLDDADFSYTSFGTSYLLDFSAPRWVQCAYAPPYEDDEDEKHPSPSSVPDEGEAGLDEAWSCPKRPPELW
jgi:hypothetical protein